MRIFSRIAPAIVAAAICCAAAPASAQHVWRHGLIKAKADAGIFLMVTTRDFAKKQGLDLKISEFKDDQIALKALISGELDSFEGGPQGVFTADSKGGDVRILGCHWVVVPHGIFAIDSIKTVKDLKGKEIAVSAPNSMPDMLARSALEKNGVDPSTVKLAAVGGDNDRYKALVSGVVQAAVVSNEYQPEAPKSIHLLLAGRDALPNMLRVCMMSSAKTLAAKGDDAARFLAAEMSALHYALTHRAETVALTDQIIHAKPNDPRPGFVFDEAVKYHMVDPTLPLPMDKFAWVQDQLVKAGKVKTPLDVRTVVAPEYREKALKMSGS
ncbi:MAG TPA: ABC transporter substrate-binding protein [Pseudolabrys sp.]|jgi:ABC-type nitrate/sulfonate/bicarbonate transport system substrate-binding protein|nr:ABC transporter substrate-binding protein [Pseudolabrys sp.]